MNAKVVMPDASGAKGLAEPSCADLKPDDMIQFERFGFVRVESASPFVAFYTHR
jgi:glutamyl-tRNA synthetase